MEARIETLKAKNSEDQEYLVYPRTLIKCITNEKGDNLEDTLKEFITENGGGSGEVPDGVTYVNTSESEDIGEVAETIDADRLGGRLPSYYININNYKDYLDINVEADFLTTDGHGKLRFYNGFFQYYNQDTGEWTDAAITPENVYIMNMTPQPMQSISATYDIKLGRIKLKFLKGCGETFY